jgi:hypothetical protein
MFNITNFTQSNSCLDCSVSNCILNLTTWTIQNNNYSCCTNCINQNISAYLIPPSDFDDITSLNMVMIVDPRGCNNTGPLNMTLDGRTVIQTQATWFYVEVVLACLLVFNVVVLTGVTIHLCLKEKKSRQKLVKLQLTTKPKKE